MAHKRITVLLSEEEYAQVRNSAGLVPLSRWFKNLALGAKTREPFASPASVKAVEQTAKRLFDSVYEESPHDHQPPELPGAKGVPGPKRGTSRSERVSASLEPCKHGAYPGFCKHEECNR